MKPPTQSPDSRVVSLQSRLDAARAEIATAEAKKRRIELAILTRRELITKLEATIALTRSDNAPAGHNAH